MGKGVKEFELTDFFYSTQLKTCRLFDKRVSYFILQYNTTVIGFQKNYNYYNNSISQATVGHGFLFPYTNRHLFLTLATSFPPQFQHISLP